MNDAAISEYAKLISSFSRNKSVEPGQMFGKPCLKINGKAFVAQHNNTVVFKLSDEFHSKAIALDGAKLWDPSGKGRPMKEWIALEPVHSKNFAMLSKAAANYVAGAA